MSETTIVIVTFNALDHLKKCLKSIYTHEAGCDFNILVIDNCSRRSIRSKIKILQKKYKFKLKLLNKNLGFCGAANFALKHVSTTFIGFLDDDTIVTDNWLLPMIGVLKKDVKIGIVGCKIVDKKGRIFSAETVIAPTGPISVGCGEIDRKQRDYSRQVDAVIGTLRIFRRKVLVKTGGFDTFYFPTQLEDTDMCLSVRKAGYKVWYCGDVKIIHDHLFRTNGNEGRNLEYFTSKWLTDKSKKYVSKNFINSNKHVEKNHSIGVNIIGYSKGAMGLGEALRVMARCLIEARIPFCVFDLDCAGFSRSEYDLINYESREPRYPFTIFILPLFDFNQHLINIPPAFYEGKYVIFSLAWELEVIPETWRGPLSFVDEIWPISKFIEKPVRQFIDKTVTVIPQGLKVPHKIPYSRKEFGIREGEYVFLTMFDYNSSPVRKNALAVVNAFQKTFKRDNKEVKLIIKTNNSNLTFPYAKKLISATKLWPNIQIINDTFPSLKIWSLINASDCIVSLHRCEGFGLVCAEAMALRKPVIATNWSGNTDFMNEENSCLVSYKLVKIKVSSGYYKKGNTWAEPSVNSASQWMKKLFEDRSLGEKIGKKAKSDIAKGFSTKAAGKQLKKRLKEIDLLRRSATNLR